MMANDESNWILTDGGVDEPFTVESAQDALGTGQQGGFSTKDNNF